MTTAFRAILYRERRRLGLVAALAFLAGMLFYWPSHVYFGQVHISLVTGTVYALVVFVAALVICTLLPRMRFMMEAVAFSRLILSLFVLASPELGMAVLSNPLLMAILVVAGGVGISRVIHGQIERTPHKRFAFGPASRAHAIAIGNARQQRFVAWVEGANLKPVAA